MQNKKIFLTFGGPIIKYHKACFRICKQAVGMRVFDQVIGRTEVDLKQDNEFWRKHQAFIENNKKGYGYWIWKSYIIKKQLEMMQDNDVLLYADSGCVLNINGLLRLNEYFNMIQNSEKNNIICFQLNLIEKHWTKMDIAVYLKSIKHMHSKMIIATSFIIKKNKNTTDFVNKWYDCCCQYNLINDSPSKYPNYNSFVENRHDQSIFSLLVKNEGNAIILDDETYFHDWKNGLKFPIHARRLV